MNKIFKIITVLIFSFAIFSCENKEEITKAESSIENLKKDTRFINLLNNEIALVENINDITKIELILKKTNHTDKDLDELAITLGFLNVEEYIVYIEGNDRVQIELENEYQLSKIDLFELQEIALETIKASNGVVQKGSDPCNCDRNGRNCIYRAAAVAAAAHFGCLGLDLGVVPGIICHAAATALQVSMTDTCLAEAENCWNDCN